MTLDEFYVQFNKTAKKFDWFLIEGIIRGNPKRGFLRSIEFCPITAMLYDMKKTVLDIGFVVAASEQLGLSKKDKDIIMFAADNESNLMRVNEDDRMKCREILLSITGIQTPEQFAAIKDLLSVMM